jgi:uncharacterized protein YcaQ
MTVSAEAARRFLVSRHLLAPARALTGGRQAVLRVFEALGSIQYDPIAVAGRAHDLVLHARVAEYDPAWCDELYARRRIFEAYNKGLSFVPVRDFAWFRGGLGPQPGRVLEENADVAERVLERVRAEGPLSALDFEREAGPTTDWFGAPTNAVRAVLEAYTAAGVLGLARREGNRRYYDVLERLLPADVLAQEIPLRDRLRFKLLSRYRAHGLLGASGAGDVFGGLGAARPSPKYPHHPGRYALRDELVERGDLVPVEIEGVRGQRFVLPSELALLGTAPEPPPSVAVLAPFDALVWDRPFLRALFGFDYVWELFLPPGKRRWGWYVLPIVYRDRFVGAHRAAHRPRAGAGRGARPLVGGRLRPSPRRRIRRGDAGGARRIPPVRRRRAPAVGAAPQDGEAALEVSARSTSSIVRAPSCSTAS